VLLDTEGTFDVEMLADVIRARASRSCSDDGSGHHPTGGAADAGADVDARVEEALSRLLVIRPRTPAELLGRLDRLRDLLAANPRVSLLVVDSMSAWQHMLGIFPKSMTRFVHESWRALTRLQREYCVALVVTHRSQAAGSGGYGMGGSGGAAWNCLGRGAHCCHLTLRRIPGPSVASFGAADEGMGASTRADVGDVVAASGGLSVPQGDLFEVSAWPSPAMAGPAASSSSATACARSMFALSPVGEVISVVS